MQDSGVAGVCADYDINPILFGDRVFYLGGQDKEQMDGLTEKRSRERAVCDEPVEFTVLETEVAQFRRIAAEGRLINASDAGIGIMTAFPLSPGHVLEWTDRHQKGKLHIAMVKWSRSHDGQYRAGALLI